MTDSNDLFQLMNWTDSKIQKLPVIELTDQEDQIVQLLKNENEIHFDELIQKTTFSVSNLQSVILNLELKQVLQSLPGARISLNHKTYS